MFESGPDSAECTAASQQLAGGFGHPAAITGSTDPKRATDLLSLSVSRASLHQSLISLCPSGVVASGQGQKDRPGRTIMAQRKSLNVNGRTATVTVDDLDMPLLYVLRDNLALHGPRF